MNDELYRLQTLRTGTGLQVQESSLQSTLCMLDLCASESCPSMAVQEAEWQYVNADTPSVRESNGRVLMRLRIVTGSFFTSQEEDCPMDEAVWSNLSDDMMEEVLRFLPAAKHFQLQLMSRKWRHVLTSTEFRNKLIATAGDGEAGSSRSMVACVAERPGGCNSRSKSRSRSRRKVKVVDIDLSSFVPGSFWKSGSGVKFGSEPYYVVAAAGGLVCMSNNGMMLEWEHCLLNPLTRTCTVLPKVPFGPRGLPPASALTIYNCVDYGEPKVATYDLASGGAGGWVMAPCSIRLPMGAALTSCAGEGYWCDSQTGRVYLVDAAGVLDPPSVALLGLDAQNFRLREFCLYLVAHRGALFFVSQLRRPTEQRGLLACGGWRLAAGGWRATGWSGWQWHCWRRTRWSGSRG